MTLASKLKRIRQSDYAVRYNPVVRRRVARVNTSIDAADRDRRREWTDRLTARIVKAAQRTPYGMNHSPVFESWPVLDKASVRASPEQFLARSFIGVAAHTSGTTGVPLRLTRSLESVAAEQVFIDRTLAQFGYTFRTSRIAVLRGDDVKAPTETDPPYWIERPGRLTFSNPHLSPTSVGHYREALERFKPHVLWGYPSMVGGLLRCLELAGLETSVPVVLLSSETAPPSLVSLIEERLSSSVVDYYGQAERACFAVGNPHIGYRFEPGYGKVELIPDQDDQCEYARVVATGYWNRSMPLIRYDTYDRIVLPDAADSVDLEAIELGLLPFRGVAGRVAEFIETADGRTIGGLNHLPRDVEGITQVQIVQEQLGEVVIRVVPNDRFDEHSSHHLIKNARRKIPPEVAVTLVLVDELERSAGGKVPFVIRRPRDKSTVTG